MRVLGLDYGGRTIGVAVSDPFLITAFAVEVIRRPEEDAVKKSVARIGELIKEYEVEKIVLGYPKHLDNTNSERCGRTREFMERLKRNFKSVEVVLWDERYSSVHAERELRSAGASGKTISGVVDKIAAAIILQSYLDKNNTEAGESDGKRE